MYIILAYLMLLGPYMMLHSDSYPEPLVKMMMTLSMVIASVSMLMILFSLVYGAILFFWS